LFFNDLKNISATKNEPVKAPLAKPFAIA